MGYSEVYCMICGISFNIGRLRRPDEGQDAGWHAEAGPGVGSFVTHQTWQTRNSDTHQHCTMFRHQQITTYGKLRNPEPVNSTLEDTEESDDELLDPNYLEKEVDVAEDAEPYELATPRESEAEDSDVDMSEAEGWSDPDTDRGLESEALYQEFAASTLRGHFMTPTPKKIDIPLHLQEQWKREADLTQVEHVASAECEHIGGYNGHHISASEMRGSFTFQCLVPKPDWWYPEKDDEDFEADCNFFLSGLGDHMPSRDYSRPYVNPPRHGCSSPPAETCFWSDETANDMAMPFHPTCLEVYKRACLEETGNIDISALTDWYRLEATYEQFHAFPRDPAVNAGSSQSWEHRRGDEFLASNPCFVSALGPIIDAAVERGAGQSDYHRGAFNIPAESRIPDDSFSVMPFEIRLDILRHLPSRSIANLRLASRTFRQLPQSLFHSLLQREAPWLWESWCSLPFSFWATTTAKELLAQEKKLKAEKALIDHAIEVVTDEYGPSDENASAEALKVLLAERQAEFEASHCTRAATFLPVAQTDWQGLYRDINKHWGVLLGVRNRERIWKDCKEILRRIEKYREAGMIGPGIIVDARETLERAREMRRNASSE